MWLVPVVVDTGGVLSYWRVLAEQGSEDLGGVALLATAHLPLGIDEHTAEQICDFTAGNPLAASIGGRTRLA